MRIKDTLIGLKRGDMLRCPVGMVVHTYLVTQDNDVGARKVHVVDLTTGKTEELWLEWGYLQQAKVFKVGQ